MAVLEVHVGTSLVYSVEGQQAVLPVWYTSHSQNKPYVTWMLNKNAAHSQVRRGQGLQDGGGQAGGSDGRTMEVPMMGETFWSQPWGSGHSARGERMPMMGR